MGSGINAARAADANEHADVMENFRDQLLIVLIKRLAKDGHLAIPVEETDDTGNDLLSFSVNDGVFNFQLSKKQ